MTGKQGLVVGLLALAMATAVGGAHVFAAAEAGEAGMAEAEYDQGSYASALRAVGLAFAAALAIAMGALATARVQTAIGAGGTGALAEKPDLSVSIIILIAIPETLVVLGFVIALLLWTKI